MSPTSYLKRVSMPSFDHALAYSGLKRSPSTISTVLASAGLISLGAIIGAGLSLWLGSRKNRKQVSAALSNGLGKVSTMVSDGVSAGVATAKQAIPAAVR